MRRFLQTLLLAILALQAGAQEYNQIDEDGNITTSSSQRAKKDSLGSNKEIPRGIYVWTVDERFGDRTPATPDTLQHMYMNSIFTEGPYGQFNTLGNLGSPRINRIFIDRQATQQFMFTEPYDFFLTPVEQFHFTNTLSPITNLTYQECGDKTNGEDHLKALFAVNVGKKIGLGFKFNYVYGRGYYQNQSTSLFNYTMFGSYLGDRYQAHLQMSTNHQKMAENGGITNDEYVTHPESFTDDFAENEIPTLLENNWNRNDHHHIFFTHRYNVGFNRKVPMTAEEIKARKFAMASAKENAAKKAKEEARLQAGKNGRDFDENAFDNQKTYSGRPDNAQIMGDEPIVGKAADSTRVKIDGNQPIDSLMVTKEKQQEDTSWLKNEYVPLTSFIHTMRYDYARRIYQAYETPDSFYLSPSFYGAGANVWGGDSIQDVTRHFRVKNTFAIALLEGFNKWAKSGLKAFVTSDLRHFSLPDTMGHSTSFNEHTLSIGGQLSKTQGNTFHYNVTAETWLVGEDAGQLKVDATADLNFPLFGDTVSLAAKGFFHRLAPTFYQRHFHSKHLWWDNDELDKEIHTRVEGRLSLRKTRTTLRIAADDLKNHTYFAHSYDISGEKHLNNNVTVKQESGNMTLLTLQLGQDFTWGPLNWESLITYQKTSNEKVLPVPELNIYSNLYLRFKIAKVLNVDLGADIRYFTKYEAPDYSPLLGAYTVQDNGENNLKLGNYPWVNVYANCKLKQARFYVMMSHVNYSSGGHYFLTPHYPTNQMILRLGISWNFFN